MSWQPGDPTPAGYLQWHAWAEVQGKAGLKQQQCAICRLWQFPQELSGRTVDRPGYSKRGALLGMFPGPVCLACDNANPVTTMVIMRELPGGRWEAALVETSSTKDAEDLDASDYRVIMTCGHRHVSPDSKAAMRCANNL